MDHNSLSRAEKSLQTRQFARNRRMINPVQAARVGRPETSSLPPAAALVLGASLLLASAPASAQQPPTRGAPVLRTPGKPGAGATPPPPPGAAKPPTGAGAGASAGAGAGADDADPMAQVKQAPKEIEFKPKGAGALVNFNLDDADLPDLVKAISNITGRRFIYGGKLRQIKATVYSPEKITAGEAYAAFLSILQQNQMTVVPHGRFLKIVDTQGVQGEATPLYGPANPVPGEERYITRMYRLQHVDPNEVATLLGKFKSKDGDISVYPPGNLIIITDTGAQIQRLLRIVEEIDVGGAGDQLWVEPIHYAGAGDIANKLNEILDLKGGGGKGGKGGGGGAKIVPDERTNSLVITATQPDYLRLLELVKRMDVPQSGEGQIHVLPLQHAGCKDLSTTLNSILGRSGATAGGATGSRGRGGAAAAAAAGGTEEIFEGEVKVVCDEASNKLVITSSQRDYAQLRSVIDELDMPRRQVFIEAVIMDVNVNRELKLGVAYHGGYPVGSVQSQNDTFLYGGNNPAQSITGLPAELEGLALGVRGPTVTELSTLFPGLSIPAFGIVLHALGNDSNSNVLATPHILATDNIPAEISIGQNVPLQTNVPQLGSLGGLLGGAGGAQTGAAGLGGLLGGFGGLGGFGAGRQDVGTKIKVTPHVNDSDQVRLELNEEISEVGGTSGTLGAVTINKRTADTTLIVRDQQTVVIGGLVRDSVVEGQTKIPVLGDLPVLGALFRKSTKTVQKTNLLLVLTPYIVRNQDDLRAIFERKMQERQEFIDRYLVFSEENEWEPPRDFSRSNGLVEDIRQSILKEEEKERLIEESKPKGPQGHEPGEPIPVPQLGGRGAGADDGGGSAPASPQAPAGGSTRPVPRPRLPVNNPRVDRVE